MIGRNAALVNLVICCVLSKELMHILSLIYNLSMLGSFWYGKDRPRWLGPIPYDYPAHLTGDLPGDYGFDLVGLSEDPVAFQKYFKYVLLFVFF